MSLPAQRIELFTHSYNHRRPHKLQVGLAVTQGDIRAAQRLRYQVFVDELGATLSDARHGMESDLFDPYCQHLLVRDTEYDLVVGCYRILTDSQAQLAGGYYSQSEFDLSNILALPGRFMEVGRTCVHPDYRNGATLGLLWSGLARYMTLNKYQYLIGCASIPMNLGIRQVGAICKHLRQYHLSPPEWRVFPRVPVPLLHEETTETLSVDIPPLLRGYMHLGALICGEPAWDPEFNVADLFILLDTGRLNTRYMRHFVNRC